MINNNNYLRERDCALKDIEIERYKKEIEIPFVKGNPMDSESSNHKREEKVG